MNTVCCALLIYFCFSPPFNIIIMCVTQSVVPLTQESAVRGLIPGPATYFRFSFRQLPVIGESMYTMYMKYCLTPYEVKACQGKVLLG